MDISSEAYRRSLADIARDKILEDIIQRRLEPGEMVQLKNLAEKYGISRTPVREALSVLQQSGLVTAIPYRGYLIRPVDKGDVEDVIAMRNLLESEAAERAAKSITDEQLAGLESLRPPDSRTLDLDFDRYSEEFHRRVAAASGSRRLEEMIMMVYRDLRRLQYAGMSRSVPAVIIEEHNQILRALRSRDPAAARAAMSHHVLLVHSKALEED